VFGTRASELVRVVGRPSVPIETSLRLMLLKFRYRFGFESLCRERERLDRWQRFCRIPLRGRRRIRRR
jgi:IS5 family transposase